MSLLDSYKDPMKVLSANEESISSTDNFVGEQNGHIHTCSPNKHPISLIVANDSSSDSENGSIYDFRINQKMPTRKDDLIFSGGLLRLCLNLCYNELFWNALC